MEDKQTHFLKVKQFDVCHVDQAAIHYFRSGKKGHVAFLEKASINHLVHLIDYAEFIAVKHFHIHFAIPPGTPLRK